MLFWVVIVCVGVLSAFQTCGASRGEGQKVYTPFFLQDKNDKSCLGAKGFTFCNENALWLLIERSKTKKYSLVPFLNPSEDGLCLEALSKIFRSNKVVMGSCRSSGSKNWMYEFLNKKDIKLISQGLSISRGRPFQNSISLVPTDSENFLPLYYYPTNIHEAGFYLKASSDGYCFDGDKFRSCDVAKEVLFGVGISFSWRGTGRRYFFNYSDKSRCLSIKGNSVHMGACTDKTALSWGLQNGQLSYNNGKMCVVRTPDNSAALFPCSSAFEYIGLEVPTLHTTNDIKNALKDDKLSVEEREVLQSLLA